ncbi:rhomboid family intramembrane serine protease [Natronomonas halophila]|uniref:rhomboid family intramembrane serine protease n=1 Tax=Natronomonas halophila TaxID=2747817 RepID=UPI0015B3F41C|nr:rhomboid family intramembrane serine protease [Natronomonas halophila]QLD87319.1 rhomboid family intramembrane serine protease [Natronomonas halophila]
MDIPVAVWYLTLAAGIAVSLGALWRLARPDGRWGMLARKRLVMGVPWGTLIAVLGVAAFYLFAQNGLANPRNPVVIPFRAWGYLYPTGMLTAGFAHAGLGHVTGNLLGTLVFGSLAEYAWSHFPRKRGTTTFSSLRTNPFARIAAWVVAIFLVGVFSALFALGPVIGFSGVVFAFIGFALVRFPLATVAATLLSGVVRLVYNAIQSPTITQTASESFSRPWWANIAIQGHALGLFVGVVLAAGLLYRRDVRPNPSHLWVAALVIAADRGLWAVYAIEGSGRFTLYRALGTALVFLVAALIASGVTATPRAFIASIDLSRREAAYGLLLATVFALALIAVPFNLFVVDDPSAGLDGADPVEVGDYTVFYAEDVENQYIPAIPFPAGNTSEVNASGVIVVSEQRNIWWEEVSTNRLVSSGEATIRLGGLTWHEDVRATRTEWTLTGGESTYNVQLGVADTDRPVVFRDERATADARIDGRNVSIEPVGDGFDMVVTRENETLGRVAIPENGTTTTVGGMTVERDERDLLVERGDTRIRIARRSR